MVISAVESSTNELLCVYNGDNTTNIYKEFVSAERKVDLTKDRHILSAGRTTYEYKRANSSQKNFW
jgi:hypothetical protein